MLHRGLNHSTEGFHNNDKQKRGERVTLPHPSRAVKETLGDLGWIILCSSIKAYILSEALGDLGWIIKLFHPLMRRKKIWLERDFEEEEVCGVVKGMEGDKAPTPDGFTMAFFQSCWAVVKHDVMAVFSKFHQRRQLVMSLNVTFVSLVPKKADTLEVMDFRPISLVGGVYQILSKVLVTRMKNVLGKIISNSQMPSLVGSKF